MDLTQHSDHHTFALLHQVLPRHFLLFFCFLFFVFFFFVLLFIFVMIGTEVVMEVKGDTYHDVNITMVKRVFLINGAEDLVISTSSPAHPSLSLPLISPVLHFTYYFFYHRGFCKQGTCTIFFRVQVHVPEVLQFVHVYATRALLLRPSMFKN